MTFRTTALESRARADAAHPIGTVRVGRRWIPATGAVLLVYLASRIVSTLWLFGAYALQRATDWKVSTFASPPDFFGYLTSWDGRFYQRIAETGYPAALPVDATGAVDRNPWAFLPLYPAVVHAVMRATDLDFTVCGVLVSVGFGAGAACVLYRLVLPAVGVRPALFSVVLFCFGPLSFILQTTYAESLFLFLMFASVLAMTQRRYLVMIPFAVAASFTHPGGLALAAALAVHGIVRLVRRDYFPVRQRVAWVTSGLLIAAAGFAWPVIAALVTGRPDAYFSTEFAWWRDYLSDVHFLPFSQWFLMGWKYCGAIGIPLVIVIVCGFTALLSHRSQRALGSDIRAYGASYAAYLFAVFLPQQSAFRMLLPLAPLAAHPALSRSRSVRRALFWASVALQPVAVLLFWVIWPP